MTEDSYLGKINDPLTLNRYNYAKSSPLNYIDPSGYASTSSGKYDYITAGDESLSYLKSSMVFNDNEKFYIGEDEYADWIEQFDNAATKLELQYLMYEKDRLLEMGLQNLSDSDSWLDRLNELMEQADLKGEATKCMNSINELATMTANQVFSFLVGMVFSFMKNTVTTVDMVGFFLLLVFMGDESAINYYQRNGRIEDFLKSFLDESAFDKGQTTGDFLSLAGSMFMIAFGGALKNGSITLGTGAMLTPGGQAPAVAITTVGVAAGWAMQVIGLGMGISAITSIAKGSSSGSNFDGSGSNSGELKEVHNSIKESPNYPDGFEPRKNGTTSNKINNTELLEKLRKIESGTWKKIYKDGYDTYGNKISIHYFQSESGKVFDVKVKLGWSN